MPVDLKPIHENPYSDDPAVVSGGGTTPSRYNAGVRAVGGTTGNLLVVDNAETSTVNQTDRPSVSTVNFKNTTPASPVDGDMWVVRSGVSPARLISIFFRDGSETIELFVNER
jgi:sorbitol-specific phosphotransferase system component IIBC